jgi:predicted RNA-binding Zn ribbon-like protein
MRNLTRNNNAGRGRPRQFDLIAGAVCLDFVNTLDDRFSEQPKELLKRYADLITFAEESGVLDSFYGSQLLAYDEQRPDAGRKTLASAVELREALFAIFEAIRKKRHVPYEALNQLNRFLRAGAENSELVGVNRGFEWQFAQQPLQLETPLWPIAYSAAHLLTSSDVSYIRTCASETCRWYFLDTSKNHQRRWCDMTKCGNRAKFQRYYERQKKG